MKWSLHCAKTSPLIPVQGVEPIDWVYLANQLQVPVPDILPGLVLVSYKGRQDPLTGTGIYLAC